MEKLTLSLGHKRKADAVLNDEHEVVVKLAVEGPVTLKARLDVLRVFSGVARPLPADASTWALDSFPETLASYQVVGTWLNLVSALYEGMGPVYKMDSNLLGTLEGVCQVLAFADAVNSSGGVYAACLGKLNNIKLAVKCSDTKKVILALDASVTCPADGGRLVEYRVNAAGVCTRSRLMWNELSGEERAALVAAVAAQVEDALHWGHKLQLQPLQNAIATFLRNNMLFPDGLLYGQQGLVFTGRVREAAGLTDDAEYSKYMRSHVLPPLLPTAAASSSLLRISSADMQQLAKGKTVCAKLRQPLLGAAVEGDVKFEWDIATGRMTLGGLSLVVELVPAGFRSA
jgi:hypothetical protein